VPHSLPLSPPKRKTFVRTINLWLSNHWCPPILPSNWVSSVSSPRKWVQLDARAIWQLAEAAGRIGVTSFMRCTCTSPRNAKGEGLGFLGFLAPGTWHVICLVFATVWFFFTTFLDKPSHLFPTASSWGSNKSWLFCIWQTNEYGWPTRLVLVGKSNQMDFPMKSIGIL